MRPFKIRFNVNQDKMRIKGGPTGTRMEMTVDKETGSMRVSRVTSEFRFAFELKGAARIMANKARAIGDQNAMESRAFVVAAIMLAWSFLDAALNEFILLNATDDKSPLNDAEKAIISAIGSEGLRPRKRQHTLEVFNLMLRLLKKSQLPEGEEPYRSANLVRILRNMLVHPEPDQVVTFSENQHENLSEQQKIVTQLRAALELDRNATFPWDILNKKCADWAVSSCKNFLREFVERSGVSPGFVMSR